MVKVAQMNIPPSFEPLLAKILAYFDQTIYPTWASRYFHNTRSAKAANKAKTYIPGARAVWATYDAATKALWKSAGAFMKLNGWLYFTSKYSYCKKHGLPMDITPDQVKQMYGLKISNPGGMDLVSMERDDIVLTGQVTIAFKYKKVEYSPTLSDPFRLHADLYYFKDGQNLIDSYDWEAPSGSVDWTAISFSFGQTSRYYFHCVITFYLDFYDADVLLDNFLVSDMLGDVTREAWKVKDGKPWAYVPYYRKAGWSFDPFYAEPFFQTEYIED